MKALVTGATGFVGSHIARQLVHAGHDLRILHRQSSKLTALDGLHYESVIGDLTTLEILEQACDGVDWVFHVAAVADYWRANHQHMMEINLEGTRRVLQAARAKNVRRVIFTSSAAAVGLRDDGQPGDESLPFNLSPEQFPYGYSKSLAEKVVAEAVDAGQDVVTVNPVVVMGPGDLNMISGSFITQVKRFGPLVPLTSGSIAVTDVRDVARWHLAAAEKGQSGERYILGTANYSYTEWFAMIAQAVGVLKPRIMVPDCIVPLAAEVIDLMRQMGITVPIDSTQARLGTRQVRFNSQKAWNAFGEPQVDMMQCLYDTVQWYTENGYL